MWEFLKNQFRKIRHKLHYDDVELKQLIYRIIEQQKYLLKEIETLKSLVLEPNGIQALPLRYQMLNAPKQYEHLYWEMPSGAVCIDCGGNIGLFSDLVLSQGGESHLFEPIPVLFSKLSLKYKENSHFHLYNAAVGVRNETVTFSMPDIINDNYLLFSQSSLVNTEQIDNELITAKSISYEVNSIRLTEFIERLLQNHESIYILKLDVEGSEFDILEDLIETQLYKMINHIFCETHERFVVNGVQRLENIKDKIALLNIENIHLDWV